MGFTIIELLISIAVIAVLIGLLFFGVRAARSLAGGAVGGTAVQQLSQGVTAFRDQVGFVPPLVKEHARSFDAGTFALNRAQINWTQDVLAQPANGPAGIVSWNPADDIVFLRGDNNGAPSGDYRYVVNTPQNIFIDNRYSELTLGYYLAGLLQVPLSQATGDLVIDGVNGAGMYKPTKQGGFDIPAAMRVANAADRRQVGTVFGPYIDPGSKAVQAITDTGQAGLLPASAARDAGLGVYVVDQNGVPMRYYRWLPNAQVQDLTDYNVPALVGRVASALDGDIRVPDERDLEKNPQLRTATWAVMAAGPNKVFGDEEIGLIARELGKSTPANGDRVGTGRLRAEAASDNIVRLGN